MSYTGCGTGFNPRCDGSEIVECVQPTFAPTVAPTLNPSDLPTVSPTDCPSQSPSGTPSMSPTTCEQLIEDYEDLLEKNEILLSACNSGRAELVTQITNLQSQYDTLKVKTFLELK